MRMTGEAEGQREGTIVEALADPRGLGGPPDAETLSAHGGRPGGPAEEIRAILLPGGRRAAAGNADTMAAIIEVLERHAPLPDPASRGRPPRQRFRKLEVPRLVRALSERERDPFSRG